MQISNPTISQFIGNTLNRNQLTDHYPVKPITIEGQVIEDDDRKRRARQIDKQDTALGQENSARKEPLAGQEPLADKEPSGNIVDNGLEKNNAQLVPPNNISNALLIQNKLNNNSAALNTSGPSDNNENKFPFGSRRSFNGLAGASLVSQNYLANEPQSLSQASLNYRNIDLFI